MPIQILWGNDLNAQNTFIQKLIDKEVSKDWKEINVTNLDGDDNEQVNKAFDAVLTPPFGEGYRIVTLKNNPIFTAKNEDLRTKFEKIHDNIPKNTYLILQNTKKPDSRLKSTKFLQKLIKNNLAKEKSFSLPEIWDIEGQKKFLEDTANEMNIKIDKNAAELIIDSVGNDCFKLRNELTKAKIYLSAERTDTNSQLFLKSIDVKKIFSDHQSNIFKIIDLLLQKNINESLIEINYSLQKGEPALRLNAGLMSQLRIHTIIKLAANSGNDNTEKICNLAGISNPKRIFFIRRKVKNVSQEYLINLMSYLLDIESLLKQGNNPINVFTEKLINLS
ncbi:DNA polymerase III subunit delta [Prochlorococcus sp. AH-716-P05]|nr:DNA polymerase III subunit delta [Prochlorococcus sp. AH-716-P05]